MIIIFGTLRKLCEVLALVTCMWEVRGSNSPRIKLPGSGVE
jgi:hypothetical protein